MYLLTSPNFLQELRTSIHIILAHQHHNSLVLSTRGLKCKKESFFACWFQSLERDAQWIQKFVKEILQKRSKKGSSQYSRNWRFLYGAWWDNAKFKQQNWIKLKQFYNIFCTLKNARTFSPLQSTSAIFFFLFLHIFLSFYVIFLHFHFISSVIKLGHYKKKFDPPRLAFAICGSKEYLVICKKMENKSVKVKKRSDEYRKKWKEIAMHLYQEKQVP